MKIILLKDVKKLGKINEIKDVSDGYAKNYLIPSGLAIVASESNMKNLNNKLNELNNKKNLDKNKYKELADNIEKAVLTFRLKFSNNNKAQGSITSSIIINELKKNYNIDLNKKFLNLNSIKELGQHIVKIKFPYDIKADLKIVIMEK